MHRFHNPALAQLAAIAACCSATMAAAPKEPKPAPTESTVTEKSADADNPPVRTSPHMGVQGPESGPSGNTVVDATSPAPGSGIVGDVPAEDPKLAKLRTAAAKAGADDSKARTLRVRATRRGYIGLKIREEGDVFVLQLDAGEKMPSWVTPEPDENVATTPLSHSSEAQPEVVGEDGLGKKLSSNDVL